MQMKTSPISKPLLMQMKTSPISKPKHPPSIDALAQGVKGQNDMQCHLTALMVSPGQHRSQLSLPVAAIAHNPWSQQSHASRMLGLAVRINALHDIQPWCPGRLQEWRHLRVGCCLQVT
eukprot:3086719-Amphidinium_carterae.1